MLPVPHVRAFVPVLLVTAVALMVLLPTPARAHTSLESSDPADGVTTSDVSAVTLTFSRAVQTFDDSIVLVGSEGQRLTPPITTFEDGLVVSTTLDGPLASGTWAVQWRILADDSHPREGGFSFVVESDAAESRTTASESATTDGEPGPGPDRGEPTSAPTPTAATAAPSSPAPPMTERFASVARIIFYLGLMAAAGLALFKAGPHRGQLDGATHLARWISVAASIALVASTAEVVLHVASVSGQGLPGAWDADTWQAVGRTGLGRAVLLRTVGLTLLLVGGRRRLSLGLPSGPDLRKLTGAALAIASFQFVGHTASAAPPVIVRSADAVHSLAAAVWIGGLVGLAVVTRRRSPLAKAITIGRFSSWATAAVIGVTIAGTALMVTNLPTMSSTWSTGYGRLLLAKLALVGLLALLGAHNHFNVVPHIVNGRENAVAELRRTVSIEAVLAVAVVALTALLVNTTPL